MNLREAAGQALEALQIWQDSLTDPSAIPGWRFSVVGEKAIAALRAALAEDRSADSGKTSDHIADANKMVATIRPEVTVEPVATINEMETVEPVAWMRGDRGHVDFHRHPDYLPLYTTAPPKREPLTEQELEPIRRRMMMEAYNAADDNDCERYNALKVMANDVLDMLLGGEK